MKENKNYIVAGLCALIFITATGLYLSAMHAKDSASVSELTKNSVQITEPAPKNKVFKAKSYTLDNGLQLVVVENHRAPVVTHMAWYRAGAADEPPGKSGIAHFLEHLLFKGHKHEQLGDYAPGEFSRKVRSLGGNDNAFTSQDYTAYFQSIAREHLETVMTMEAGRMTGLDVPLAEVESENKVIQEERRQRTDNSPKAQMTEQLREALFPNHPYSIPIIGWMHEIEELTWEDAKSFYDIYYAPNNAIVVVSGDVVADEVFEIAQRTYGLAEPSDLPDRARTKSPPFIANTHVTLTHEIVNEPVLQRVYRVPGHRINAEDSLALQVLEEIMGGGSSSRLYKSIVVDQKLATDINLSYRSSAWDDSTLSISAVTKDEGAIDAIREAIDEQMRALVNSGVSDEELSDAVRRLKADAVFALDSVSGPAMIIGSSLITGSSLDDIEYWPYHIESVSKDDVQRVARTYLNPDAPYRHPPVTGVLLPENDQKPAPESIPNNTGE